MKPLSPWLPVHSVTVRVPAVVLPPPESLARSAVVAPVAASTVSLPSTPMEVHPQLSSQ